jgi:hypothetical protein
LNKVTEPNPPWYRLDTKLNIDRGNLVIAFASTIIGSIIGWAISALFASPDSLSLWTVLSISLVALMTCVVTLSFLTVFQAEGRDRLDSIGAALSKVELSLEQSATLVNREDIYPQMARCIREAEKQVAIITFYMYDWEEGKRTFEPAGRTLEGLDDFYEAIYDCIKDPDVRYLRVWQVPKERLTEARAKIMLEPRLAKEIELIEGITADFPDRCKLKISPVTTTASMILVDGKTLFLNVDLYDSDRDTWMSPFMLMIRDARGKAFDDLKRVVARFS